jgi:nucleoside-diphosphate-sugar epimerase
MQVLVTGHKGYVGSVLTSMLVEAGFDVVGLDRDWFRDSAFADPAPDVPEIEKDFRDLEVHDLTELDAVLHLAALSDVPLSELDRALTYDINHKAAVRLAVLAKQARVRRFVFASTCTAYPVSQVPATEEAALEPSTIYEDSKVRVEVDLRELADERFSPVSLRSASAYGLSPRLRLDSPVNRMVAEAATSGEIVLTASREAWYPAIHVEDLARVFLAVLKAPQESIHDRAFNVGRSNDLHTIGELAQIVAAEVPGCVVSTGEDEVIAPLGRVDFSRIERELTGWEPQWEVRTGVRQLYEALAAHGGPQDTVHSRLDLVRKLLAEKRLTKELRWRG